MLNCKPTAILQRRQLSRYDLSDALVFTQWRMLVFLFSSSRHHSMRRVHSAPTASPSSGNYTANTPVGDSNNFTVEIHKINDPLLLGVCVFGHLPFEHLLVWAACPFEHLYCWATFNCAIKMPNTIACLTGYPQDMCVATATHGPQACTLSLCSVPAASRRRVLIKSCSTVQMLNDTHESAQ